MSHYLTRTIDDIIPPMEKRRAIALWVFGLVAAVVFVVGMYLLVFGGYYKDEDRVVLVSIGIGPIAAFAVAVGYCAWWLVMFVLTLLDSDNARDRER